MIGAEFLGMMMLIVYVGAVAVLFLFVVMLMNVTEQKLSWFRGTKKTGHIPVGLIIGTVILLELIVIVGGWRYRESFSETEFLSFNSEFTNTHDWKCNVYRFYTFVSDIWNNTLISYDWCNCFNL